MGRAMPRSRTSFHLLLRLQFCHQKSSSSSSYAMICTVHYCSSMSHLVILARPGYRLARLPVLPVLPASARTQEIFLDSNGASRRAPVGQVALTGQKDRPEWILRWLEPP